MLNQIIPYSRSLWYLLCSCLPASELLSCDAHLVAMLLQQVVTVLLHISQAAPCTTTRQPLGYIRLVVEEPKHHRPIGTIAETKRSPIRITWINLQALGLLRDVCSIGIDGGRLAISAGMCATHDASRVYFVEHGPVLAIATEVCVRGRKSVWRRASGRSRRWGVRHGEW